MEKSDIIIQMNYLLFGREYRKMIKSEDFILTLDELGL